MRKSNCLLLMLFLTIIVSGINVQAQFSSVTATSIDNNNLKIDLTFDEDIYSNSSCSTLTCIEISDFGLSLTGGSATLKSNTPITITRLGNYDFTSRWAPGEPNNAGNENYAQHRNDGQLNDLANSRNLNGILEVINPIAQVIPGYTWFASWPLGSECAHSYYKANTAKSWSDSKADATNAGIALGIGADLLVYNSQEEFEYMITNQNTKVSDTWIGLRQYTGAADYSEPSGGWYWDDGTPMDNSASKLKYQITIALNGVPNGDELVTINPITAPASVFSCAGVSAVTQVNGLNQVYLNDKLDPYIVSSSITDDNTKVRVVFNEDIFTDADGNPLLNSDFTLSLVQNGSAADLNSVNPTSIANYGDNVFDLLLPMNGLPITGKEVLTILPTLGSVFDAASNVASSVQSNNVVNFNPPKTGPIYLSNIYKTSTVSGSIVVASETFLCNDVTFNNYNQAYHDGIVLEPQVGNYIIYNNRYSYPSTMIDGSDFGYFHLRGFNRILEIRKSDGLVVAKYSCD
jgi:hypothetical protein